MVKLTKEQKVALGVGLTAVGGYLVYKYVVEAAPPTPVCTPGEEKCIGLDWCRCKEDGTGWIIVTPNDSRCLPLVETAILYGLVTDIDTGYPIAGIVISCDSYTDTTGTDGLYRIEDIPPGTYTVTFSDPLERYETEVR